MRYLILLSFAIASCLPAESSWPKPTAANVSYGPHERNVLDEVERRAGERRKELDQRIADRAAGSASDANAAPTPLAVAPDPLMSITTLLLFRRCNRALPTISGRPCVRQRKNTGRLSWLNGRRMLN